MAKVYKSKSHIQGIGLFAKVNISQGDLIGRYKGRQTNKDGKHVLWVWMEDLDDYVPYKIFNIMKYANHSNQPNAEVICLEMYALRDISKDEEITFNYGDESIF